jgi:hypothetical protein
MLFPPLILSSKEPEDPLPYGQGPQPDSVLSQIIQTRGTLCNIL